MRTKLISATRKSRKFSVNQRCKLFLTTFYFRTKVMLCVALGNMLY